MGVGICECVGVNSGGSTITRLLVTQKQELVVQWIQEYRIILRCNVWFIELDRRPRTAVLVIYYHEPPPASPHKNDGPGPVTVDGR